MLRLPSFLGVFIVAFIFVGPSSLGWVLAFGEEVWSRSRVSLGPWLGPPCCGQRSLG